MISLPVAGANQSVCPLRFDGLLPARDSTSLEPGVLSQSIICLLPSQSYTDAGGLPGQMLLPPISLLSRTEGGGAADRDGKY
ncbi:unnamed protein product [Protopolystoma xenopodis]|uniref:Uncharacterized protein n=1 Tax=Protopolystoma xenopodis TaxID=117903 RepID=A0A448XG95_9PLAT|nr:unnamed protein product [Protopolystoma xenopodis]